MAPGVKFNIFEVFFFCEISDLTHAHIAAILNTQVCTDFDVCIKLTVFEQFRPPDYENDFGFALSRLVFSQIVFS
jgi:hypothetical protein